MADQDSKKIEHMVTCKNFEDVEPAKELFIKQGGKITDTRTLYPGFTVEMPKDSVSTFEGNKYIDSVEVTGEVSTRK
ncbi:hypothetical protein M430DRAFT_42507 [Amorphotheca resinae ATCC 22711]|uniref:Inhibitor I9 domain-containing protein n=1 Tax=Amorphotheca resinae ATCC 22711 TaxID=857342 RepID=A0A2T3AZA8_AMORE|nr:hypothetical protein M430DRAFT_42507 [Amorphotheca resinae ATCC 22711]PSS16489.1 hypothetical protein M430DRAFT_42507 [Amorphotheca resinae ATCC 22711]